MTHTERKIRLKPIWDKMVSAGSEKNAVSDMFFNNVMSRYNEKGRYHHTSEHLLYMYDVINILSCGFKDADIDVMIASMFYHDAIYNPRSDSNEADSSELATGQLSIMRFDDEFIRKVTELIFLTKHHDVCDELMVSMRSQNIFIDADISILASTSQTYNYYSKNIRKEYSHVPDDEYNKARIQFLEGKLKQKQLFNSQSMHSGFTNQAFANMKKEIILLKKS